MKVKIQLPPDKSSPRTSGGIIEIEAENGDALVEAVEKLRYVGLLPTALEFPPRAGALAMVPSDTNSKLDAFVAQFVLEGKRAAVRDTFLAIAREIAISLIRGEEIA